MTNRLFFKLQLKDYPYPNEVVGKHESWGRLLIKLETQQKQVTLLDWEWNLAELATWFAENHTALCKEMLNIEGNVPLPTESLAQALNRFQERDFAPDEQLAEQNWLDQIFAYKEKHSLRFALRGAAISNIIIGLNHGSGEISVNTDKEEWAYSFDMIDFCTNLEKRLGLIQTTIKL